MGLGKVRSLEEMRKERPKFYSVQTLDLATARNQDEFHMAGNNLRVIDASDLDARIEVRFNEMFNDLINMQLGRLIELPFYRFFVTHAAQAGKTLTIAAAMETDRFDIRDDVIPWVGIPLAGVGDASYGQVSVTTSATLIKAENLKRHSIVVQNLSTTHKDLYLGYDASLTTGNAGHILNAGESIELFFTGTIYGRRSAGSENAGYLEESKV